MGWIMAYIVKMITGSMKGFTAEQYTASFNDLMASPTQLLFWTFVCTVIIGVIAAKNLNSGLEKACKFMMPALFIMLITVVIRSVTLPGAAEGIKWYLNVDFSKVTPQTFLTALGQCFFSVGIASGGAFVYGSYLKKDSNIPEDGLMVVGFEH